MKLQKDQFPVTIQAFELRAGTEFFIAEQVVNNQADADAFSNRYAGKIIKAKAVPTTSPNTAYTTRTISAATTRTQNRKSSSTTALIVILLILAILIAIGFYTGWIQRTTGIRL